MTTSSPSSTARPRATRCSRTLHLPALDADDGDEDGLEVEDAPVGALDDSASRSTSKTELISRRPNRKKAKNTRD